MVYSIQNKVKKFLVKKFLSAQNYLATEVAKRVRREQVIHELNLRNNNCNESLIEGNQDGITVSLTTFGNRINDVYLAIESIGLQTLKPGRILLWLTENEYSDIPISLKRLEQRGLIIKYYKDIKAYKKLIPTLKNFPEDIIITIDDDVMYNRDLVETLYSSYLKNPGKIYCGEAKWMEYKNGLHLKYKSWKKNSKETYNSSYKTFPIGIGGVLYFPNCFHEEILNEEKFLNIAPFADDIWYKSMSLLQGVECVNVNNTFSTGSRRIPIQKRQVDSLSMINVKNEQNDKQLEKIMSHYSQLKIILNEENIG